MRTPLVYLTVLVIATCGLVYELGAGTLASYVLGDSVTQFSTVIGVYLSAMGLGSYLSRWVRRGIARRFIEIELAVGLIGGLMTPLLFLSFAHMPTFFRPVLYSLVILVGTLVGLEIPLILRLLKEVVDFKDLVAQVLTFDYIGALVASLLFPILLIPTLGLTRTSLLFGLLNAVVGLWSTWIFAPLLGWARDLRVKAVVVTGLLLAGFVYADRLTAIGEEELYADPVVYATSSRYQRIVLTSSRAGFQLFLNGSLQFSSTDEYRYHEALVHPAMALVPGAKRVLVLGGGDGLAVREVLRYAEVEEVVLVDLDPAMTALAANNPSVVELNQGALRSPKVRVENADAFIWLKAEPKADDRFDIVLVDFPDPHNYSLGKLYTSHFYRMLKRHLQPHGVAALQTTSPLLSRRSYWCVQATLKAAGFHVAPYHALVPSFGEWGFALAAPEPFEPPTRVRPDLRYLDAGTLRSLFVLSPDMGPVPVEVNRLDNQVLVHYYDADLAQW